MSDWRKALLKTLHFKPTPQNLKFLDTWQRWEGGHTQNSAKWNWLNTTHGEGAKINSVGVRAFSDFAHGIRYTAETLQNGRYNDILDALSSGDPYSANPSGGLQTWVSGRSDGNPAYAQKILGGHAAQPLKAAAMAHVPRLRQQIVSTPVDSSWDDAMKMIWDDDPWMAKLMGSMDDSIAQASGAVSKRGSLRPIDYSSMGGSGGVKASQLAATQLGKPYVFGSGPGTDSFDCSDLIQWAYKQMGISIPRTTFDQIKVGRAVKGPLKPGDLIFPTNHHVVMYVGNGKVIAAPHTGTVVQYQPLPRYIAARRII